MKCSRFVVLAAFAVIPHAFAGESYVLRQETAEGFWDFDTDSVVVVSDAVRTSQMSLKLKRPFQDQLTGNVYDRVVFQYEHDCKENRMRVVSSVGYFQDEPVKTTGPKDDWHAAADNAAHKRACSLGAK